MTISTAVAVLVLLLVHLFAGHLRFLDGIPRSRWLSIAAGISVAYVFLHVFPELGHTQQSLTADGLLPWLEHHVYVVALLGLTVFYGVERLVKHSRRESARRDAAREADQSVTPVPAAVFWLHVGSFSVYNTLVGYLLVREQQEPRVLFFFALAMAVHFLVNDYGLRQDHRGSYHDVGRWVLAAAVVLGSVMGELIAITEAATGLLFAFLGGGVVLNVLKEELPEERQSRFGAFAAGAAGYSLLLLLAP